MARHERREIMEEITEQFCTNCGGVAISKPNVRIDVLVSSGPMNNQNRPTPGDRVNRPAL